jgi:Lsr2
MAQKVTTVLVDDFDNTPIEDGEGGTVSFSLDGAFYEIDLNAGNSSKLHDVLLPYIAKARKSGRKPNLSRPATKGAKEDLGAAREWLRAQGHEISDRGRIAAALMEEYRTSSK